MKFLLAEVESAAGHAARGRLPKMQPVTRIGRHFSGSPERSQCEFRASIVRNAVMPSRSG
jgi:hypothetical protein